jgi:8-oxo-dGTP pyrophosphatase MutT (NUDIX family)
MAEEPALHHFRHTARGIVVHDSQILLMERWRGELHYFSIPGGGIEKGETPEETVVRELNEETTITVNVGRQVLEMRDGGFTHKIYLCEYVDGEPHLPPHAPEAQHGQGNQFKPGWQPVATIPNLPFTYWQPLQQALVDGLRDGFGESVKIVNAAAAR